jgi:hypothetical protein
MNDNVVVMVKARIRRINMARLRLVVHLIALVNLLLPGQSTISGKVDIDAQDLIKIRIN